MYWFIWQIYIFTIMFSSERSRHFHQEILPVHVFTQIYIHGNIPKQSKFFQLGIYTVQVSLHFSPFVIIIQYVSISLHVIFTLWTMCIPLNICVSFSSRYPYLFYWIDATAPGQKFPQDIHKPSIQTPNHIRYLLHLLTFEV